MQSNRLPGSRIDNLVSMIDGFMPRKGRITSTLTFTRTFLMLRAHPEVSSADHSAFLVAYLVQFKGEKDDVAILPYDALRISCPCLVLKLTWISMTTLTVVRPGSMWTFGTVENGPGTAWLYLPRVPCAAPIVDTCNLVLERNISKEFLPPLATNRKLL